MHTHQSPRTDTILSNQGVASLIFSNALEQVAKLAKVSKQEALALLITETEMGSKGVPKDNSKLYFTPIVEHTEQKYISSLFK